MDDVSLRRRAFVSAVGAPLVLGGVGTEGVRGDSGSAAPPSIPPDPYIVTANGAPYFRPVNKLGWESASAASKIETVLGLHPDFLDFHRLLWVKGDSVPLPPGVKAEQSFAATVEIAGSSGQTTYLPGDPEKAEARYGALRRAKGWAYPDGTPLDSAAGLYAKTVSGETQGWGVQGQGTAIPSVFAPGTLDILEAVADAAYAAGFSGEFLDSALVARVKGFDTSRWAQAAFREHVRTLPAARQDELGIDPGGFDIRKYLKGNDLLPGATSNPAQDPVYREYVLTNHEGLQSMLEQYHEWVGETYPSRAGDSAVLYGNQFIGEGLQNAPVAAIYASDIFDVVNVEDRPTVPPDDIRDYVYKLYLAASRGKKPVLFEGQHQDIPGNHTAAGLDTSKLYATLLRLQIAEAYAMGAIRKLPLTGWGNVHADDTATMWIQPDGSVPESLQSFVDFLWTHRRFLKDATPNGDVALVYSLPTLLWKNAPQWGQAAVAHTDSFRGGAALLREAHIPYDVTIFGHPRLWTAPHQLDGLNEYDAVVLPHIECLTSAQRDALDAYAAGGGTIVSSGPLPSRDGDYTHASSQLKGRDRVSVLAGDPARGRTTQDKETGALADALPAPSIETTADKTVGINRLQQTDPARDVIHLLNYDYDKTSDSVTPKQLSLTVTDRTPAVATFYSPQTTTDCDLTHTSNGVQIHLPTLHDWGFVVLADNHATLESTVSESTAKDAMERAKNAISTATTSSQSDEQTRQVATVTLENARKAYSANAYALAAETARTALATARSLPHPDAQATTPNTTRTATPVTTATTPSTTITSTPGFNVVTEAVASIILITKAIRAHTDESTDD